ncbi:MAG: single-stranded-DNA-specific exonuclease RecJ [Chloroflexi bacterium]|nr:single-stranded-DNA-specific exonuclease RecJ [Chloroflexota bacterium]
MKWKKLPPAPPEYLSRFPNGITPLLAQILYNRGVTSHDEAEVFLTADKRLENDPYLLPGMAKAVARIKRAVLSGETIAVFGDFDADGVTASALLIQGLEQIGGKVIPYIPHRVDEGHGLNIPALRKLREMGATLVITVDCGITANAEAQEAKALGLELIITDHHEVVGPVPEALVAINPKLADSPYPFRELAGVGVAYKLLDALFREMGRANQVESYLDLVAVGTVADMVPLLGENRYLVKRGIEVLNQTGRLGILGMLDCAGREPGQLDADTISYVIGPRLNAAGRMDHASIGYDLLMADSLEKAWKLAQHLEVRNAERQRLTSQFTSIAEDKLAPILPETPFLIVADTEFRAGINGVVAGKLADKYYRPAVVLEVGDRESSGSGRSIPEFNMIAAFVECADLLTHFGGHAQAAGFGIPNENIERLRQRLTGIARRDLAGLELQPTIKIDAEVSLSSLNMDGFKDVRQLEPCGQANTVPTFLSRGVRVLESRSVGSDGEHLKLRLADRGAVWEAIGFGLNYHSKDDVPPLVDIVYSFKLNKWRGQETLQLEVFDFVPSA